MLFVQRHEDDKYFAKYVFENSGKLDDKRLDTRCVQRKVEQIEKEYGKISDYAMKYLRYVVYPCAS